MPKPIGTGLPKSIAELFGKRSGNEAVSQYGGRRIAWGEVCRDEARHRLVGRVGDAFQNINAARFEQTTANKAFLSTTSSRAAKTAPEWVPFGGGKEVDIAETPKGVPSAKLRLADGHGNMAPKNNAARLARTTANTAFLSTTSFRPAKTAPEWVPFWWWREGNVNRIAQKYITSF